METSNCSCGWAPSRRDFLRLGLAGVGTAALPMFLKQTSLAMAAEQVAGVAPKHPQRIMVVLELSGGNDGLNTVVPYANDEYHRLRPALGIRTSDVLKVSEEFGFHPNLLGFEGLFKNGHMAVVHGCGYPNPDRSHFTSMRYWHTGAPHASENTGWLGRYADAECPEPKPSYIVNVGKEQSLAVQSAVHAPVVFSDPNSFVRLGTDAEKEVFARLVKDKAASGNRSLDYLRMISKSADASSDFVRNACAEYRTKMDYGYGEVGTDLRRILALINAGSTARIYYLNFGSFDTHVSQSGQHTGLFNRLGDAVQAFYLDLKRVGRADDVGVMMFSEFGRRVKENASLGTDHGVAGPMFIVGAKAKGGFYGKPPSLTDLDEGDLKMTTDFRSVYATMIKEWMGFEDVKIVLRGDFPTLGVFV
jgi:uncharacterized protein (DUF1501 family)